MFLNLKEEAIIVADAHYPNHQKEAFLSLLNSIKTKELKIPQLILMGDIFDLLVGNSPYLKDRFKKEIELLDSIAKEIEVIYLEGNHDFYLKPLFKNIKVIPLQKQPLLGKFNDKTIAISHGDIFITPLNYKIYTKVIRNPLILKILPDLIAKYKLKSMQKKSLCKDIKNFKDIVKQKGKLYKSDIIIEGHFHQGVVLNNYYALPSFACNEKFAIVKNSKLEYQNLQDII